MTDGTPDGLLLSLQKLGANVDTNDMPEPTPKWMLPSLCEKHGLHFYDAGSKVSICADEFVCVMYPGHSGFENCDTADYVQMRDVDTGRFVGLIARK